MKDNLILFYISLNLLILIPSIHSSDFSYLSCPDGYISITHYSCAQDNVFMPQSTCPKNQGCATSYVCQKGDDPKCPALPMCPSEMPLRCPDNTCVEDIKDCNNYVECPSFLPVRCPNNDCNFFLIYFILFI